MFFLLHDAAAPRRFRISSPLRRFAKGGGSSQSTSSTSNQTVNDSRQTDNKIATSGTSIVAAGGSSVGEVTIESQDAATTQAAISAAASTSEKAILSNSDTSRAALTSAERLGRYSFDAARDLGAASLQVSAGVARDTLASTDKTIAAAARAFEAAQGADTSKLQDTLTRIALGALLVGGVVGTAYILKKK